MACDIAYLAFFPKNDAVATDCKQVVKSLQNQQISEFLHSMTCALIKCPQV